MLNSDGLTTIVPVTDLDLVTETVKHPKIWPWVSDDGCNYGTYRAQPMLWLGVYDTGYLGCFGLHQENSFMWQIHTCLLPAAWGKAKNYGIMAFRWMFSETECQKIITLVPADNHLALKLAKNTGMIVEGLIGKSFMKNGQLLDQTLLGINRGDLCQ